LETSAEDEKANKNSRGGSMTAKLRPRKKRRKRTCKPSEPKSQERKQEGMGSGQKAFAEEGGKI